ncbi:MAG: polysaccharide biosynthesis C-terminal domain-containing protein [Bacteroidetes bacterium]|nr:polysaccharide biosynthesis C-terminal domain-containing protein [Bacteroidota bacterium]
MFGKILNTFGTRSLAAVLNLLIAIILSQYIGPEGKGQQGLLITTIALILVFSNLVGGATLVYLVPRFKTSQLFLPSYFWSVMISLAAYGIVYAFPVISSEFTLHIAILSAINSFASINTTILIGKEQIRQANFISLLQPLLIVVLLLIFFSLPAFINIYAYIIALYFSFGISWLTGLFLLRKLPLLRDFRFRDSIQAIRDLFRYGFLNQLAHITQLLSFRLSYYILNSFHGEGSVGIYSNGIALMESVWLISKSISLVQYARIANLDDKSYSQSLTVRLLQVSLVFSLLIILPLLILPASAYVYIFGEGFSGIKTAMWALAPGVLIYNINIIVGHYFSGTGKYQFNTLASGIGLAVSLISFYLLIPAFDVAGAGWATSISYFATSLVILYFFRKDYSLLKSDWIFGKQGFRQIRQELRKVIHREK